MQPAKLVNKSIAPRFAAIIITLAPLTSCGEWTGACEAGCLCFRDRNSCEANGCSWNGSYCPNGPFGDDGGIADARDVGDAGAVDAGVSCGASTLALLGLLAGLFLIGSFVNERRRFVPTRRPKDF